MLPHAADVTVLLGLFGDTQFDIKWKTLMFHLFFFLLTIGKLKGNSVKWENNLTFKVYPEIFQKYDCYIYLRRILLL